MALQYTEQRTINAPDTQVFDVIADFEKYGEWNPWIERIEGQAKPGSTLVVDAVMGNKRPKFKHRMIAAERPHLFHWCDLGWFTLFAYGERKRTIKRLSDTQCEYRVELKVTGIGSALASRFFGNFMRDGLKGEADALKNRAEWLARP